MCTIIGKYKGETFTGYKYAYKKDGKYYSFWTGIEYKPGKVKRPKPVDDKKSFLCADGIVRTVDFNKDMIGKTGVFCSKKFAEYDAGSASNVLLKITISGDLQDAFLYWSDDGRDAIVVGSTIVSIEEVKPLIF